MTIDYSRQFEIKWSCDIHAAHDATTFSDSLWWCHTMLDILDFSRLEDLLVVGLHTKGYSRINSTSWLLPSAPMAQELMVPLVAALHTKCCSFGPWHHLGFKNSASPPVESLSRWLLSICLNLCSMADRCYDHGIYRKSHIVSTCWLLLIHLDNNRDIHLLNATAQLMLR